MALSDFRDEDGLLEGFRNSIEGVGLPLLMKVLGAESEEVATKILKEYEEDEANFHARLKKTYDPLDYVTLTLCLGWLV